MSRHTRSFAFAASFLVTAFDAGAQAPVAPGDDFFAYANAEWLAATEIPAGLRNTGLRASSYCLHKINQTIGQSSVT